VILIGKEEYLEASIILNSFLSVLYDKIKKEKDIKRSYIGRKEKLENCQSLVILQEPAHAG
jgi:hypothetical protein